jgi:hypothetical protein
MARAVGIDFKFTGDPTKAVAAFRQIAQAAKGAGGEIGSAGRQIETALAKAEKQAQEAQKSLRGALAGGSQSKAGAFLGGLADSLGLGEFADQFGGIEEILGGVSTKAAVAATGVAALGAVTIKFGKESLDTFKRVVEQVDAISDVSGASAEEASKLLGVFKGLGVDAGTGANAMAKLAKAVGTNEGALLRYGIVVAKNADGSTDLNGTLLNVASAYQATEDPAKRAAIASAAFGKSWADMVDVLDKSRSKIAELQNLSPGVSEDDIRRLEDYKQATAGLSQSWDDTKLSTGRQVIKLLTADIERATGVVRVAGNALTGDFGTAWDVLTGKAAKARSGFALMSDDLRGRLVASALQAAFAMDELGNRAELASVRAANAARAFSGLFDTQTTAISAQVRFKDAISSLAAFQQQAAGQASKYADAQDNVAAAIGDQARAASDGARRIADAERESAESIVDAQERVADARERAARSAMDAADRVADAERALRDAGATGAGENPLEQRRRIEEAQIQLERAKRDQVETAQDGNKDIARSEADLVKAQEDGQRRIEDARREAAEAQADALARVSEAQGRATAAIDVGAVSVGNMTSKVDDLVSSTFDAAYQTAAMGGSQEDVKRKVDESKQALEEFGPQIGLTAEQIDYYKRKLDLIPATVRTRIVLEVGGSGFTSGAVARATAGVIAAAASQLSIPQFAGGGTFRAPGGGAGLAILHDGEKVLTPEQQQNSGGTTVNVYGAVISDRDLMEIIGRAERAGYGRRG